MSYKGGSTGNMLLHIKNFHSHEGEGEDNQPKLTSFMRRCDPQRSRRLSELISQMIAVDGLPVSFVEGEGFKTLMKTLEPDFTLPTRKTIVKILNEKFERQKDLVKDCLGECDDIALTTDCWTSLGQEGYMTVTAHALDGEWQKQTFVLDTSPVGPLPADDGGDVQGEEHALPQRHMAPALQAQLRRVALDCARRSLRE